jgi:hypothetical protein
MLTAQWVHARVPPGDPVWGEEEGDRDDPGLRRILSLARWTELQRRTLARFRPGVGPPRAALLYGTGTGKSWCAVGVALSFLAAHAGPPRSPCCTIVCPARWHLEAYRAIVAQLGAHVPHLEGHLALRTMHELATCPLEILPGTRLLVLDEVHHWLAGAYWEPDSPWRRVLAAARATRCRVLFLTATPVRDQARELAAMLAGLAESWWDDLGDPGPALAADVEALATGAPIAPSAALALAAQRCFWDDRGEADKNFPSVVHHGCVPLAMSPHQTDGYLRALHVQKDGTDVAHAHAQSSLLWVYPDGSAGMEGWRRHGGTVEGCPGTAGWWEVVRACSAKFHWALQRLVSAGRGAGRTRARTMVYFPHVQAAGVHLFVGLLAALGWRDGTVDGDEDEDEKPQYVWLASHCDVSAVLAAINHPSSRVRAIVCGPIASEAMTFLGVTQVFYMSPHWNEQEYQQVVGRVVRLGAHRHLPGPPTAVEVWRLVSRPHPRSLSQGLRQVAETSPSSTGSVARNPVSSSAAAESVWPHSSLDDHMNAVAADKAAAHRRVLDFLRHYSDDPHVRAVISSRGAGTGYTL